MTEQKRLQEDIVHIAAAEQRRIGEELHDGTQQELTGLGLMARHLAEMDLSSKPEEAKQLAARLAEGIASANRHVQELAKGLIPVGVDAEGLGVALSELAARTANDTGIACKFECPRPVSVPSDFAALHLFRIAQEAITNAVKHASPSRITLRLTLLDSAIVAEILDDGIGISEHCSAGRGLGRRLMEHRCSLLGGTLHIRRRPAGGTEVKCRIPAAVEDKKT